MNKSESIAKLAESLAKAQGQLKHASKDGVNPHYKSAYATLTSVIDAIREPLTQNGLSWAQTFEESDDSVILVTTLLHNSGEWLESRLKMKPTQNTPQGVGSAITYARRYALSALVGVAAEDDDGEAASIAKPNGKVQSAKPQQPTNGQMEAEIISSIKSCLHSLNKSEEAFNKWFMAEYQSMNGWREQTLVIKKELLTKVQGWMKGYANERD